MFAGHTQALPYVRNYAEAAKHFNTTPRPRSTKWDDHQRPLKDTRSWHYRVEQNKDNESYDVCLYTTVMARFHKPDAEGVERRQYFSTSTQTSRGFLRDVLQVHAEGEVPTTTGERVLFPVYPSRMPGGESFSMDAYFTSDDKLIVERSQHTRHYKRVSDTTDKALRKLVREKFEPLLTLAALQLPDFSKIVLTRMGGGLFYGASFRLDERQAINRLHQTFLANGEIQQQDVDLFMTAAFKVFSAMAHVRADKEGLLHWKENTPYESIEPIKERELISAIFRQVCDICCLNRRTGRVEYPQFPKRDQMTFSNVCLV
jgi:hypothetical protein